MKKSLIISLVLTILSAVLALGTKFVFHACAAMEGECKSCVNAQNAIIALGVGILILSVVSFLYKSNQAKSALYLGTGVFAVIAMLLPNTIIPLCVMPDMHCLAVMRPAVLALGLCILVVSVIGIILHRKDA